MNKKISSIKIIRLIVQIISLILAPGIFILTFGDIKSLYVMILQGNFTLESLILNILILVTVLIATIVFGRFFCGWLCAFGTFMDLLYLFSNKVFKVRFKVPEKVDKVLKYFKYVVLGFTVVFIWTLGIKVFDNISPWNTFAELLNPEILIEQYKLGLILLGLIAIGGLFIERFFCRYLCPLGAIFVIVSKIRIFKISKNREGCGKCRICTLNCPMGIPMYKDDKINSGECIDCFECIPICPRKNTKVKVSKKTASPLLAAFLSIASFVGLYEGSNQISDITTYSSVSTNTSTTTTASSASSTSQSQYADGTYTGSAQGFKGTVTVSVVISNGKITEINLVSDSDDAKFFDRAFSTIPEEIIQAQSTKVDTVSGATYSSNGIINAVQNALDKAKETTTASSSSTSTATENTTTSSSESNSTSQSKYTDGTYTGSAQGFKGTVTVSVVISNGKITEINLVSDSDDAQFFNRAFNTIPEEIIQAQSTKVDTVSGATYSSNGIINAVQNALDKAES